MYEVDVAEKDLARGSFREDRRFRKSLPIHEKRKCFEEVDYK